MVSADVKHHVYLLPLGANGGDCVVGLSDRKRCEFCIHNYTLYSCLLWVQVVEIVLAILIVKDASSVGPV